MRIAQGMSPYVEEYGYGKCRLRRNGIGGVHPEVPLRVTL
jgi:hypothetical protein